VGVAELVEHRVGQDQFGRGVAQFRGGIGEEGRVGQRDGVSYLDFNFEEEPEFLGDVLAVAAAIPRDLGVGLFDQREDLGGRFADVDDSVDG